MKYKLVGLGILILLCWLGCCPQTCRSDLVWADNFDDATYEPEWTIIENPDIAACIYGFCGSNWTAVNQYLEMLPSTYTWGAISRSSDVVFGNWSFDIKFNLTDFYYDTMVGLAQFSFIGNDLHDLNDWRQINSYQIQCMPTGSGSNSDIELHVRKLINNEKIILVSYETPVPSAGWHHINVTRTTTGLISVYLNDSLIMQAEDTDINTSESIHVRFQKWQMIDNISIDDEVLPPPPPFPIEIILIGVGVAVVAIVIVIVVILIRRRRP